MDNFVFHSPTKVIFGQGVEEGVGKEIIAWGGKKVLLHYGSQSAKKSGLIDRIKASLDQEGLAYCELSGVLPNPRLSKVQEGIALCKENGVDFILAVGGGSVLDSAKCIAMGAANEGEVWDFWVGKRKPVASLPVGSVLTIAAAGSETSMSCVITNETEGLKRGLNHDFNRPKFAIMNPELTYSLPPFQVACGIVDIMMHTLDRYFSPTPGVDFVDRIGEALLQSVIYNGAIAMKEPENYTVRANIMWAGSISHNTLTGTGKVIDFSPHQLGHELSAKYDVAHGASLSAVWGHWARFVCPKHIMRFAQYANRVWNLPLDFEEPERTALQGIEMTENYFRSLGMPTNFKELGIAPGPEDIHEMAEKCTFFGKRKVGSMIPLGHEEMMAIYQAANQ